MYCRVGYYTVGWATVLSGGLLHCRVGYCTVGWANVLSSGLLYCRVGYCTVGWATALGLVSRMVHLLINARHLASIFCMPIEPFEDWD